MSSAAISNGKIGEELAQKYLLNLGFSIITKNFRCRFGEIDCIAKKDDTYYFIEVKARSSVQKGYPYEAINTNKLSKIKKSIDVYCLQNNLKNIKLGIVVISIVLETDKPIINFYNIYD